MRGNETATVCRTNHGMQSIKVLTSLNVFIKKHHGWGVAGVCSGCLPAAVEACRPLGQLEGATASPRQAVLYCQPHSSPPAPANPPSELMLWSAGGCAGMQGVIRMAVLKVTAPVQGGRERDARGEEWGSCWWAWWCLLSCFKYSCFKYRQDLLSLNTCRI